VCRGTVQKPIIDARERIEILGENERFVFHLAAEMKLADAARFIAEMRAKALENAGAALARFDVKTCAIVAKDTKMPALAETLASHPRSHTAEGAFYRDILRDASPAPARVVFPQRIPASIERAKVGRPWTRDHKLAALAALEIGK
jgi:hypothetical protein